QIAEPHRRAAAARFPGAGRPQNSDRQLQARLPPRARSRLIRRRLRRLPEAPHHVSQRGAASRFNHPSPTALTMKLRHLLYTFGSVLFLGAARAAVPAEPAPVKIFFDTDMMTDCDD